MAAAQDSRGEKAEVCKGLLRLRLEAGSFSLLQHSVGQSRGKPKFEDREIGFPS